VVTLHRLWNTTEAKTLIENLQTGEALVKTEKMEVAKKVKMESKF